jgi:hypothetical protein
MINDNWNTSGMIMINGKWNTSGNLMPNGTLVELLMAMEY